MLLSDNAQQNNTETPSSIASSKGKERKKRAYFILSVTTVQIIMLLYSLAINFSLTGSLFQTTPVNNLMLGPAPGVLIQLGARFTPCMKVIATLSNSLQCPQGTQFPTNISPQPTTCTIEQICGIEPFNNKPPNQWYRFFLPIFLHGGIVHLAFNLIVQISTGSSLEKDLGSTKIAFVYLAAGVGGFLFSGIFSTITPSVGASGSIYGLFAFVLVDLIGNWKAVERPKMELVKVLGVLLVSFFIGMLPYLDNFAHIGGFIFGLLASIIVVESSDFFKLSTIVRRTVGTLLICGLTITLLIGFYSDTSGDEFCPACKYLNCIPSFPWCEEKWKSL